MQFTGDSLKQELEYYQRHGNIDHFEFRHWAGLALKKAPLRQKLRLLGVRAENLYAFDSLAPTEQSRPSEGRDQLTLGLFESPAKNH